MGKTENAGKSVRQKTLTNERKLIMYLKKQEDVKLRNDKR